MPDRFPGLDRMDTGSRMTYGTNWSAYLPQGNTQYAVIFTFVLLAIVLAIRPYGIFGRPA